MVQGYTQQDCGGKSGWTSYLGSRRAEAGMPFSRTIFYSNEAFWCSYSCGVANDQWAAYLPKEPKLPGVEAADRETGGTMLSVTGLNQFYYLRDFTDMRCKHSRVLSIIHEQLHREPNDGDVFIVMSRDRRIVRLFTYDNRSYSLFEKKFVSDYKFMKVEREGGELVYRIDWKDVVLLLENPIVKTLKIK
jgi:transposase